MYYLGGYMKKIFLFMLFFSSYISASDSDLSKEIHTDLANSLLRLSVGKSTEDDLRLLLKMVKEDLKK